MALGSNIERLPDTVLYFVPVSDNLKSIALENFFLTGKHAAKKTEDSIWGKTEVFRFDAPRSTHLVPIERYRLFDSVHLDGNLVSCLQIGAVGGFHLFVAPFPPHLCAYIYISYALLILILAVTFSMKYTSMSY